MVFWLISSTHSNHFNQRTLATVIAAFQRLVGITTVTMLLAAALAELKHMNVVSLIVKIACVWLVRTDSTFAFPVKNAICISFQGVILGGAEIVVGFIIWRAVMRYIEIIMTTIRRISMQWRTNTKRKYDISQYATQKRNDKLHWISVSIEFRPETEIQ